MIMLYIVGALCIVALVGWLIGYISEITKNKKKFEDLYNKQTIIVAEQEKNIQKLAYAEFEKYRATELENLKKEYKEISKQEALNLFQAWITEYEADIRHDARKRSYFRTVGQVAEQFVPFDRKNFEFNPKDARFLGNPIDMILFDGLYEKKDKITIYFLEIKTGNSKLNDGERLIKDAVENLRIEWKEIYLTSLPYKSE